MHSPTDDDGEPVSRARGPVEFVLGRGTSNRAPPQERLVGWLTDVGEVVGNALVYSSAYLGVIAMVEVAIVMVLLGLPPNPAPVVVGLVTFAVYANDRIHDVETDAISNPERSVFILRYRDHLYVLAAVAYAIALALSVLGGPGAVAITLIPGIFWILYASNWIPEFVLQVRRLKEVLLVNSLVVALAWSLTVTFLPITFAGIVEPAVTALVFLYFLLGTFVNTEIPNVPDLEADRAIGVSTLPAVLGVSRTRQVLWGVDILTAVLLGIAILEGFFSMVVGGALLVGLAYSIVVTWFVGRTAHQWLLTIAAESEYVVVFVALAPFIY